MKCPICKEIVVNNKCSNCGFDKFLVDYTNADEVVSWFDEVVIPYRNSISKKMDKTLKNTIKKNIKTDIPEFEYKKTKKGICITKYNRFNQNKISIPSTIENLPVIELGERLFDGCSSLEEIILPETIQKIGVSAFSRTNIVSLNLPKKLKTIPAFMCYNCKKLTNVNLQYILSIEQSAFDHCENLEFTNLGFNNYLKNIGSYAFSRIKPITNLIIPRRLKIFEYLSFEETLIKNLIVLNDEIQFDRHLSYRFKPLAENIYCNPGSSTQQNFRHNSRPLTEFKFD